MKLILVRHGETEENKKGIMQGHIHGKLTALGKEQAKKLAKRFKNEKIDAIYSSDLARASDTTKEIKKFHKRTPVYHVEELREVDHGDWTGLHKSKIDWEHIPKNFESMQNVRKRTKKILDQAYKKYPNGTVLFSAHGGVIKHVIALILGKPKEYIKQLGRLSNTSVCIFEIKEDKKHILHLFNCTKHLD